MLSSDSHTGFVRLSLDAEGPSLTVVYQTLSTGVYGFFILFMLHGKELRDGEEVAGRRVVQVPFVHWFLVLSEFGGSWLGCSFGWRHIVVYFGVWRVLAD